MNRSFSYVRFFAAAREYLWTTPGDRWLGMWQQVANHTEGTEVTTAALEHRRCWLDRLRSGTRPSLARRFASFAKDRG